MEARISSVTNETYKRYFRYQVELYKNKKLEDTIYFGSIDDSYYIDDKNVFKLRYELYKRGAIFDKDTWEITDPVKLHVYLENVKSVAYFWDNIYDSSFWERWLLNGQQRIVDAKRFITQKTGITFIR